MTEPEKIFMTPEGWIKSGVLRAHALLEAHTAIPADCIEYIDENTEPAAPADARPAAPVPGPVMAIMEVDRNLLEEAVEWLQESPFAPARELAEEIRTRLAGAATPAAGG